MPQFSIILLIGVANAAYDHRTEKAGPLRKFTFLLICFLFLLFCEGFLRQVKY